MNRTVATRDQCREVDRRAIDQYGMSGLVLMENAGRGVVDTLQRLGVPATVVVCCGKGNNAGDGFVIARHLDIRRIPVRVFMFCKPDELAGDARTNFAILHKTDVPIEAFITPAALDRLPDRLQGAAWIVDTLLGTGARGEPRSPLDKVIDVLNAAGAAKLAVDVPSGLDCDTGQISKHTFRAEHTCTFVAAKTGFRGVDAESVTGIVHVLDIGAPRELIDDVLADDG